MSHQARCHAILSGHEKAKLQRVVDCNAPLPVDMPSAIEDGARPDWGGERHYIAKVGEGGFDTRDYQVRAAYQSVLLEDFLSLRYNLTVRRTR